MKYEFHKGDRVVCVESDYGVKVGELGTVCVEGCFGDIGVRWDIARDNRHNLFGECDDHHGLWFYASRIAPYIHEEETGDVGCDDIASLLFL